MDDGPPIPRSILLLRLAAKTRATLIQSVLLPRLELCYAVLAVKLVHQTASML